ncbi:MAG: hypothetical protein M5T61_09515 [Acidimicrobiia bacterium]|nr:hypothetical protein [Acidimicrobiia bacterium]
MARGALGLRDVIDIAHSHSIPVIVDAAAQLPPASNLWSFTADGADLVLFSGGKGMRGPVRPDFWLARHRWSRRRLCMRRHANASVDP